MKKTLFFSILAMLITFAAKAQAQTYTYIDEDGDSQNATSVIDISGTITSPLSDGWYYVSSASTMTGDLEISGDVKLILDKDLTIDGKIEIPSGSSLTIYGTSNLLYKQATLSVDDDINAAGTLIINSCLKVDTYNIGSDAATISILGGQVSADAIKAANLTLGYKSMDDKIVCGSITANAITIAEGCSYQLDGNTYSGALPQSEITNFCDYVNSNTYVGIGMTSEVFVVDNFSYTILDEGERTVQVSGWAGATAPENIEIPSSVEYNGTTYTVTKIGGSAFCYPSTVYDKIHKVTIPGSIVEIKEYAFSNSSLEIVEVEGNGLKFIGDYAFSYIPLKEITLPASIEYIGASAFENCFNESLTVYCNAVNAPELGENALNATYRDNNANCYLYIPPCADYSDSEWQDFFGSKIYGYVPFDQTGLDGTYDKEFDGSVDVQNFTPVTLTPADGVTLTFTKLEFADPNVEVDYNGNPVAKPIIASYNLTYSANEGCNTTGNEIRLKEVSATITPHEITQAEIESVIKSRRTPITDDYYAYAKAGHYEGSNNGKLDGRYTTTVVLFPEDPAKTAKFRLNAYYVDDESSTTIVASANDAKYIHIETNTDGFRNKDNYETHNYAFANSYENFSGAIGNFQPYVERSTDETTLTFKYGEKPTDGGTYYDLVGTDTWMSLMSNDDKKKVTTVVFDPSFKDAAPTSCSSWFYGFETLSTIEGIEYLNTANATNMSNMFNGCSSLTSLDLSSFNTGNVTDMSYMFNGCSSLTSLDLSSFNTSKVTNMESMFNGCSSLTSLDLSSFYTRNVTNMYEMFAYCSKITGILVDVSNWDIRNVTDGNSMFDGCSKLIGDKGTTTISITDAYSRSVTYARVDDPVNGLPGYLTKDKFKIFYKGINNSNTYEGAVTEYESAVSLVAPTKRSSTFVGWTGPGITEPTKDVSTPSTGAGNLTYTAHWDKEAYVVYNGNTLTFYYDGQRYSDSRQTTGSYTFDIEDTYSNGDRPAWVQIQPGEYYPSFVKNVTFDNSFKEFRPVNCSFWFDGDELTYLESITGMKENLNTSSVTNMAYMFFKCKNLTSIDVSGFNTANVTSMQGMFSECNNVKILNLIGFNTEKVTDMSRMFSGTSVLKSLNLSSFKTENVTTMNSMFGDMLALTTIYVDASNWNTSGCRDEESGNYMFSRSTKLVGGAGTAYDANNVTISYARIDGGEGSEGYLTNIEDNYYAFFHEVVNGKGETMKTLSFHKGAIDASLVGDYYELNTSNSTAPDWLVHQEEVDSVAFVDAIKAKTCYKWFFNFKNLKSISGLDNLNTEGVTSMTSMFSGCAQLESIDLSKFNTASVTDFSDMFFNCQKVKSLDFSSFVINGTPYFTDMFRGCATLTTLDASKFKNAKYCNGMFSGCTGLTSVKLNSGLVTTSTSSINEMFNGCSNLKVLDLRGWVLNQERFSFVFKGCNSLTTILVDNDWNVDGKTSIDMFDGCTSLIGDKGTQYREISGQNDIEFARIDDPDIDDPDNDKPGYFTTGNYKIFYDLVSDDGVSDLATASELASAFATNSPAVTEFAHGAAKSINNPKDLTDNPFNGWTGAGITKPTKNLTIAADDPGNRIYTANWTVNREAYAVYDDTDGKNTLTFYFDANKPDAGSFALNTADNAPDWGRKSVDVLKVVFDDSFQEYKGVTSCYQWFKGFSKLTALDLRNLKTSNVTNMTSMFNGCSSLTGILIGDNWSTDKVTASANMFTGCTSLIGEGGNFVPEDETYQDKTYAYAGDGYYGYGYLTQGYYKIIYDLNDGDDGDAQFSGGYYDNYRTENCSDDEATTLETPTWTGHIFSGWSKATGYDFDEYEYVYDTEEPLHIVSVSPGSGNMVLMGLWDKNHTITLPGADWKITDEFGRDLPKDSNANPTAPIGAKIIIEYQGSKVVKEVEVETN